MQGSGGSALWWIILVVVWVALVLPDIGGVWYLILMVLPGSQGENRYG